MVVDLALFLHYTFVDVLQIFCSAYHNILNDNCSVSRADENKKVDEIWKTSSIAGRGGAKRENKSKTWIIQG